MGIPPEEHFGRTCDAIYASGECMYVQFDVAARTLKTICDTPGLTGFDPPSRLVLYSGYDGNTHQEVRGPARKGELGRGGGAASHPQRGFCLGGGSGRRRGGAGCLRPPARLVSRVATPAIGTRTALRVPRSASRIPVIKAQARRGPPVPGRRRAVEPYGPNARNAGVLCLRDRSSRLLRVPSLRRGTCRIFNPSTRCSRWRCAGRRVCCGLGGA